MRIHIFWCNFISLQKLTVYLPFKEHGLCKNEINLSQKKNFIIEALIVGTHLYPFWIISLRISRICILNFTSKNIMLNKTTIYQSKSYFVLLLLLLWLLFKYQGIC